jgi:Holliday junction resolvase RusA-like endonuclease
MITFTLPLVPSTNALWRSGRGRVHRSDRYKQWQRDAGWELALQGPRPIPGPVAISVAAGRPDRRRRDLDNIATKAVLDLLVAHQVISDDSMVAKISATWASCIEPGRLQVEVASCG